MTIKPNDSDLCAASIAAVCVLYLIVSVSRFLSVAQ